MNTTLLELCDIHASYTRKDILRGVTLTVRAGETVTLLGENGAGKSTVLRVVAGLLQPSKGVVRYRGRDLNGMTVVDRQRLGIGYLIQGGRIFPNLTVQENFDLAVSSTCNPQYKSSKLGDWFPALLARRDERAGLLSGGQRQMLAIELVLAQQPAFLLLDEPTGALSGDVAMQMMGTVKEYIRQRDAASLLVEHDLTAIGYATRHLHLVNGVLDDRGD
jgi:branched-chain amino acid transport system ATP-binding protein